MQNQPAPAASATPAQPHPTLPPAAAHNTTQVPNLPVFLRWIVLHQLALPVLLLAWALLLWLGGQIPQINSALTTQDGLSRHDLLLLDAQGWTQLPRAGLWWLLLAITAIVLIGRQLFSAEQHVWQAELPINKRDQARALLGNLALPPQIWTAVASKQTVQERAEAVYGTLGHPKLLAILRLSAALTVLFQLTSVALEPQSVRLDVAMGQPLAAIDAWTVDGGSLSPAAGRWRGACAAQGSQLKCALEMPGTQHSATVAAGYPADIDGNTLTWLAVAPAPVADKFALTWAQNADKPPVLLRLAPEQALDAPTLHARISALNSHLAGPIVLIAPEKTPLIALTSPIFAGAPRAEIRPDSAQTGLIARLHWAPTRAPWPWALALALAFAALILDFTQIHAVWTLRAGQSVIVTVRFCNRAAWLQRLRTAIAKLGDGFFTGD